MNLAPKTGSIDPVLGVFFACTSVGAIDLLPKRQIGGASVLPISHPERCDTPSKSSSAGAVLRDGSADDREVFGVEAFQQARVRGLPPAAGGRTLAPAHARDMVGGVVYTGNRWRRIVAVNFLNALEKHSGEHSRLAY